MNEDVLVTGATGFVGQALLRRLAGTRRVLASTRVPVEHSPDGPQVEWLVSGDLADAGWAGSFPAVDAVVHLAALAHAPPGSTELARRRLLAVNGRAPVELARQAAAAGARRFLFLSSVKVLGERSERPFRPDDQPAPADPYGEAKQVAEQGLRQLHAEGVIDVVIVRCPLVYGPGVKGNFRTLVHWVRSGIPLPFGAVANRRSVLSTWNLADCLVRALDAPTATGATVHVTDGEAVSTAELVRRIARACGLRPRLFPVPQALLRALLPIVAGRAAPARLLDSLELDDTETRARLDWQPPLTLDEGLLLTVRAVA